MWIWSVNNSGMRRFHAPEEVSARNGCRRSTFILLEILLDLFVDNGISLPTNTGVSPTGGCGAQRQRPTGSQEEGAKSYFCLTFVSLLFFQFCHWAVLFDSFSGCRPFKFRVFFLQLWCKFPPLWVLQLKSSNRLLNNSISTQIWMNSLQETNNKINNLIQPKYIPAC